MLSRRGFTSRTCAAVGIYAFLEFASTSKALAAANGLDGRRWIEEQQEIAAALQAGRLSLTGWQEAVEALAPKVDLPDLLAQTDFERLKASFDFKDGLPSKRMVRRPKDGGSPAITYGLAYFGFRRGQAITPHGHRNMVSAHMVASGAFRVRNFDRLRDEPNALILRPTVDERNAAGRVSTMSSERNNIHWFVAEQDESATLDVIIDGLDPSRDAYTIDLVDPDGGQKLGDGTIRAPLIDWKTSVDKYA